MIEKSRKAKETWRNDSCSLTLASFSPLKFSVTASVLRGLCTSMWTSSLSSYSRIRAAFSRAISFCSPWTRIWKPQQEHDTWSRTSGPAALWHYHLPHEEVSELGWTRWSAGSLYEQRRRYSPRTSSAEASVLTWWWSPPAQTWYAAQKTGWGLV